MSSDFRLAEILGVGGSLLAGVHVADSTHSPPASADVDARRHVRAWLLLVGALAVHVVDEAATGFLDFYNPLVERVRADLPWFPMPTFSFGVWLVGLAVLVVALGALSPVVRRGGSVTSLASWFLATVMFLNGLGHLAGSLYFQRWLPGATSAPLLLVASALLAHAVWRRGNHIAARGDIL